jgi:uncharacterized membrane protein YhaH (DUF805 family)
MFEAPFSFEGRIRRTEYGISFIIYIVAALVMNAMITVSSLFFFLYIPILWFLWAQGAKRCHDRNNSGWYQIIPFYFLILIFSEGDEGTNYYGEDPKAPEAMRTSAQQDILDSEVNL